MNSAPLARELRSLWMRSVVNPPATSAISAHSAGAFFVVGALAAGQLGTCTVGGAAPAPRGHLLQLLPEGTNALRELTELRLDFLF